MNLKTTLFLLLLAAGCVMLFWKGPDLAPRLGLTARLEHTASHGTLGELEGAKPETITGIEVVSPEAPKQFVLDAGIERLQVSIPGKTQSLIFTADSTGKLQLQGNWPARRYEIDELVHLLTHLQSRFQPVPLASDADLMSYGLDPAREQPIAVTITMGSRKKTLTFGEEPGKPGENPFIRSCYVRVGDEPELLRLGPDVLPILRRDEEAYRRRQLFPEAVERVKIGEGGPARPDADGRTPTVQILGDKAKFIEVSGPFGRFVLERVGHTPEPKKPAGRRNADPQITPEQLAEAWIVAEPYRDHVDPARLTAILTAIPELIVESFEAESNPFKNGLKTPALVRDCAAAALFQPVPFIGNAAVLLATGVAEFEKPDSRYQLKVTLTDGSTRQLIVGGVARSSTRFEQMPSMIPGQPPQQRPITDEVRYAKIGDNPIAFELRDDRFNNIFFNKEPPPGGVLASLRDPIVIRFDRDDVNRVELVYPIAGADGKTIERTINLVRTKGDKNAEDEAAKKDRWQMTQPVASAVDAAVVVELLDLLKGMEATGSNLIDRESVGAAVGPLAFADLAAFGLTPDKAKRVSLDTPQGVKAIMAGNQADGRRYVMVPGWNQRINRVNDPADGSLPSRLDRQPSGYRDVKLLDALTKIEQITVDRAAVKEPYTLENVDFKWSIISPFKAEADKPTMQTVAGDLNGLGTKRYVYDPATDAPYRLTPWPELLTAWNIPAPSGDELLGLDKPAAVITVRYIEPKTEKDQRTLTLEIGKSSSPKSVYARVKGTTGVFEIPEALVKALDQKPEGLVDRALIELPAKSDVQLLKRVMNGQDLEFGPNNSGQWEMVKPAKATVDQDLVDKLLKQFDRLRAVRIEAVAPKSLKDYGLEPPVATVTIDVLARNKPLQKGLLVGNPVDPADPKGNRYAKTQDSPMVAVISGSLADRLLAEPLKFRDLNLGGFVKAEKITLERGDRKITFTKGLDGWKVTEPVAADTEDEDLRELHDMLASLKAEQLVEDQPNDLAKYGLDKPMHWRFFNSNDREVLHLLVGDKEKIGADKKSVGFRAYAMLDKGNVVVLLDPALTAKLNAEYRKRSIWEFLPPDKIKEISIKAPDAKDSFTLTKGPIGWIDPEKPTERLNNMLVNELLLVLSSLKVESYVADKDAAIAKYGLDKPRTVTVVGDDGKKRTLLIGTLVDGKRLYAKIDDPARTDVFMLSEFDSASLDRPRAAYELKGEEKK